MKELNKLPLAIEQAGVLLKKDIVSFSTFIAEYRAHYQLLMDRYSPLLRYDKQRPITAVFSMLYLFVKKQSAEAAALLIFIAILGPWQIPLSLMKQFQLNKIEDLNSTDEDSKALKKALDDHTILRLALDCLADVCLIKLKRKRAFSCQTFTLHGAICQWCVEVAASEKPDWIIQAAHGLAMVILDPTERCVGCSINFQICLIRSGTVSHQVPNYILTMRR